MKRVIVWSGGADSTLLLARACEEAQRKDLNVAASVAAMTLEHHQFDQVQLRCQRAAMRRFMAWAAKRGWDFKLHTIKVTSKARVAYAAGQFSVWASIVPLYAGGIWGSESQDAPRVEVQFGYIKRDIFWHFNERFTTAFRALAAIAHANIEPAFPLEWFDKEHVIDELRGLGVPRECWWTCERPAGDQECGYCPKCKEVGNPEVTMKKGIEEIEKGSKKVIHAVAKKRRRSRR